ncbi:NAD(P)-binding domain-containing protein [Nonomuraea sp. NPDC050691]|uniref:NAD(P)-binding domain-containing protein n=1 Tax=Nonomuraea sp. NPDC050691 TaxID=3155661 RepID=UPI00340481BF
MTADDTSSRQVWLGTDGILAGARPDTVLISAAPLSVDWAAELAARCAERGLSFFDMPLTGGAEGARTGNLVMLVGGDPDRLAALRRRAAGDLWAGPALRPGRRRDPVQAGAQRAAAAHMAAFGEAIRMAEAAGLDLDQVGQALVERPGGIISQMAWSSLRTPPEPINFSAEWAAKDLSYARRMNGEADRPILDAVLSLFSCAVPSTIHSRSATWAGRVTGSSASSGPSRATIRQRKTPRTPSSAPPAGALTASLPHSHATAG